ncbi:uncharacterized protein LOC120195803 isoform X2 [Hibiscus syriacus]|uniref:uncharacterized protein LOC120195803 isoform X2 n=1 Tax=Hibiscus syriacus TaxID=106335 RepID=UPI0019211EE1|nr:uncharacterized protein LOC120195803 isoform X2 [Hibiscus syriacus]
MIWLMLKDLRVAIMMVCERLGIDKKKSYSRFFNMFSRFGMHLQAESLKKTTAYRVWTSGNSYCKSSNAFLTKSNDTNDDKQISSLDCGHSEVPDESNQNLIEYNPSTSAVDTPVKVNDMENDTEISCSSLGETNNIVLYSDNVQRLPSEQSNTAQDAELDLVMTESQICASPPKPIGLDLLKSSDSGSYQTYSSQVLTADGARREQRILGRLQDEKFLLRAELYRRLVELEKDKSTKLDRKTVDRLLKKLQQQGHCKCVHINVPVVTNCGRSRITQVVLHPSVEALNQELISEIHDRLRSFEMQVRGHGTSKLKSNDSIPVLDGVQRTQGHVDSDAKAAKSEAIRANGFVLAKMVRSKLLHRFLWGFLSSFHGWDDDLSLDKHLHDQKNLHGSCILFSLEAAIKAIPLELFLQVVGTALKFDDMIDKCNKGFCLSDLHIEEYKLLMDTQATVRLSLLIDILRRLKLIRLVPDECSDNRLKVPHANLTHAMELKPYIEEPLSWVATSTSKSLDLRPRIRHDFILSNREAVDDYWKTLEYCYAAADPRAALHAFPGSAVHEVFLNRSWVSDRVMTAVQRAELLKRIVKDDLNEKLSYRDCEKIAKDLSLTLQQVLRVYYDKQQKRLNRFRGFPNSNKEQYQRQRYKRSSNRKRKRGSTAKSKGSIKADARSIQLDVKEVAALPDGIDGLKDDYSLAPVGSAVSQANQEADNVEAMDKLGSLEEDEECDSLISQSFFPKMKSTRKKRISWTDKADRELVTQYARYRAAMGAKIHRVDWTSLAGLPAPPHACARRMASLNRSEKFRKALMKLCNMLSERFMKHLEKSQNTSSDSSDCRLLRFPAIQFSYGIEHGEDADFEVERWDDFDDRKIKSALEDVLRFKQIAKLDASARVGSISAEWSSINMNSEVYDQQGSEMVLATAQDEYIGMPGAGRRKGSIRSSEHHCFRQKLVRLWNVGNGVGRQVHESLAVSNAVELFKLVFLSISTAPQFPNLLSETLHRYSEHDLFAAFSYLRDRKIMIGGTCGQPFVLSQQFLHSISKSPFPCNTGKRAADFSAWISEREEDLMEGGINLTADLQCGDILHLFSLVFSGELSLSPCLPDEGVGEAEDLRSFKRRAEDNELCDADKAKKLKSIAEGEFVSRREKGFPGIMVSVYRTTFPTATALELFKDEETFNPELSNDESSTNLDHIKEMLEVNSNVTVASKSSESPWEDMASYTKHLLSNPSDEGLGGHFGPEIIKAVCSEIQKAGDQGLSIEDVFSLVKFQEKRHLKLSLIRSKHLDELSRSMLITLFVSLMLYTTPSIFLPQFLVSIKILNHLCH